MNRIYSVALLIGAGLVALPFQVWADSGHPEEKSGGSAGTYILLAFTVLLLGSAIGYILQKRQLEQAAATKRSGVELREKRLRLAKRVSVLRWVRLAALIGLLFTGALNLLQSTKSEAATEMEHIHGLGYSPDGRQLMFAAHDGLRVYSPDGWSAGQGEKNDYMGFSVADHGFYSSGHPALTSKLKNPFGIVRSLDEGRTVEPLAYYGAIDFHVMSVGYRSHALYVYNPQPHAQMKEQGIYYSLDEGKTWTKSAASGLSGEVTGMAAHPDQASTIAVGTSTGVYLSQDAGKTFEPLASGKQITGITYTLDGGLLAGTYESQKAGLVQISPATKDVKELSIPTLEGDAVAFLAAHPQHNQEYSFATYKRQAYTSTDGGVSWRQIVKDGKGGRNE